MTDRNTSNRLPILAVEIRRAHADVCEAAKTAAERALAAGSALVEAKSLCAHGEWSAWLAETGIPERTAQRYMSLQRAGCISAIMADYGLVRAAEFSALGLKMYPAKGRAKKSWSCTTDQELGWLAYWWRSGDNCVTYSDFTVTPVGGRAFFTKKPMPVFALGLFLSNDREIHNFSDEIDISETAAKTEVEEVLAA